MINSPRLSHEEGLTLYERLRQTRRLECQPEGSEMISRLILATARRRGELNLTVDYHDGRRADLVVDAHGRLLRGGLTSASESDVRPLIAILSELVKFIPADGPLPHTIYLPRPAFVPDERMKNGIEAPNGPEGRGPQKKGPHEERLEHLNRFHGGEIARFQFDQQAGAFGGYICTVYPGGFFLEMPEWQHAAFQYNDPHILPSLGINPSKRSLTREEKDRLQHHVTNQLLPHGISKRRFVEKGAVSLRHVGNWQERFASAMQKLLKAS